MMTAAQMTREDDKKRQVKKLEQIAIDQRLIADRLASAGQPALSLKASSLALDFELTAKKIRDASAESRTPLSVHDDDE